MNRTSLYPAVSATLFAAAFLAHLSRLVWHWPLEIAHGEVPGWYSVVGLLASGALSAWGYALAARAASASPLSR